MLHGAFGGPRSNSLMSEYATLLGDSVLRQRTRSAEEAARIEAEFSNRIRSEFIANMSHELRTPLNTVIGFSKILSEHGQRKLEEKDIIEYAGLIHTAAVRLLSVINDILDISKIQSGKCTIDTSEVNLDKLIKDCVDSFQPMAAEAGLTLVSTEAIRLPNVSGDLVKLRQIFTNLISNAVRFTPRGGRVEVQTMPAGDGSVAVFVRDTGVGMTEEEIELALTPFGQAEGGRSRWREGAGLGLSIAVALVELHGGHLGIRSSKGLGTEVGIMLPAPKIQSNTAQAHQALDSGPLPAGQQ